MEKIRKEATTTMTAGKKLKTKLSTLSKTQEADQRLLENINKMISDASNVISKYLGVRNKTVCSRTPYHPCNFASYQSLFSIFVLPHFDEQFLDDPFGNSDQTVSDLKKQPDHNTTEFQPVKPNMTQLESQTTRRRFG
jgi:hypothetical protein